MAATWRVEGLKIFTAPRADGSIIVIFNYFSFSFDSLQSLQLLQVLNDVFAEINPQVLCRASCTAFDLAVHRLDSVCYKYT